MIQKNNLKIFYPSIVLFFIIFLLGVFIYKDYGISWDEDAQRTVGTQAFNYILDRPNNYLHISDSNYGPAFEIILVTAENILGLKEIKDITFVRHFIIFLFFFISLIFFYLLINKLTKNRFISMIGVLFLLLSPRIFADSFYNSKDIPALSSFIISIYLMIIAFEKNKLQYYIFFAIATGISIDIRITGIILYFFALLYMFMNSFKLNLFKFDLTIFKRKLKLINGYFLKKAKVIFIIAALMFLFFDVIFIYKTTTGYIKEGHFADSIRIEIDSKKNVFNDTKFYIITPLQNTKREIIKMDNYWFVSRFYVKELLFEINDNNLPDINSIKIISAGISYKIEKNNLLKIDVNKYRINFVNNKNSKINSLSNIINWKGDLYFIEINIIRFIVYFFELFFLFLLIFILLTFFSYFLSVRFYKTYINFIYVSLFLLFSIILFMPLFWTDPIRNFISVYNQMSRYPINFVNLYFGSFVPTATCPWHYTLVWIAITSPTLYILLFFIGLYFIIKENIKSINIKKIVNYNNILIALWFFVPILTIIFLKAVLYDAFRQIFFVYPAFLLIGIIGLNNIYNLLNDKFSKFKRLNILLLIIIGLFLCPTIVFMIKNHPFQNVYFTDVMRLNKNMIDDKFELDYWGLSNRRGLEALLGIDKSEKIIVYEENWPLKANSFLLTPEQRKRIEFTVNLKNAAYIQTTYRARIKSNFKQYNEIYSIKVDDIKILSIFKLK